MRQEQLFCNLRRLLFNTTFLGKWDERGERPFLSQLTIFTARCYASAVLDMALYVRLSVRPSQVGVLLKRLNVGSHKQHHTIAQGL